MERRHFISVAGGLGLGLLIPGVVYRYLMRGTNVGNANIRAYLNDGPMAALRAITPTEDFYLTSSHGEPAVDEKKWSLTVDGFVKNRLRFSYDEIRELPPYETILTLECISNSVGGRFIVNAQWTGTLLKPVIERAAALPAAQYAVFYAPERYTTRHPISRLDYPADFPAYHINCEAL